MSEIELVVVNGCSMTYGDELRDRHRSGWPGLVANHFGAELVNLGACAGSNQRVVRQTVELLPGFVAERGLRPDQVLYLAMWSRLNRAEVYSGAPDLHGGLPDCVDDAGWLRIHPTYIPRRDPRAIAWYRHLQTDHGDAAQFMSQWVMFDAWLASTGVNYGFLWAFDPDPVLAQHFSRHVDQLRRDRILGAGADTLGGPSLFSVGQRLGDLGPDRHPLERSHATYADETLMPWLDRLVAGARGGLDPHRDPVPVRSHPEGSSER